MSSSAGYGRKATIQAVQDNPDRKTRTRTTRAPQSEIKMKKGKRDNNQIKSNNEVNRHSEKHREGLDAEK